VIDLRTHGDFRIDSTLRDEIRAMPLDSADDLSADDLDVQETRIQPMGPGLAYVFEVWLQPPTLNVAGTLIGAGILAGCKRLKTRFSRLVSPTASTNTYALPPEKNLPSRAKFIIGQHYTVQGDLRTMNVEITDSPSLLEFSGTADFSEKGGRTFHVIIDHNAYRWKLTQIVRKHPEP
jgi:hypothetical protein